MLKTKPGILALLFMTSAYASSLGCAGPQKTAKRPFRHITAEFRLAGYDGHILEGRVLVQGSYGEDDLPIHNALVEFEDVSLEKFRACGKTELLPFKAWDSQRPRVDDIITLTGLRWHGYDVQFALFDRLWPLPDCFEADLVVRAADGRIAARLPIRVERTDKPPAPSDGGAPAEPKPPAPDAGAP